MDRTIRDTACWSNGVWRIANTALCGAVSVLAAIFPLAGAAADPPAATAQDAWTHAQTLRTALKSVPDRPAAPLGETLGRVHELAFIMGMLMDERKLGALLSNMETSPHPPDRLALAAFWRGYGEERTVRREGLPAKGDIELTLVTLTDSETGVVRLTALALLSEGQRGDQSLSPERMRAVNELARFAPDDPATESLVLRLLADEAIDRWAGAGTSEPRTVGAIAERGKNIREAREIFGGTLADSLKAALYAATQHEDSSLRNACLRLVESAIGQHPDDPALISLLRAAEASAEAADKSNAAGWARQDISRILLSIAVRAGQWDEVRARVTALADAGIPAETSVESRTALLRTVNESGMALVRAGREKEAEDVFRALASFYPESQVAVYALEHINHLRQVSSAK